MTRLDKIMVGSVTLAIMSLVSVGMYVGFIQSDVQAPVAVSKREVVKDTVKPPPQSNITINELWEVSNKTRVANGVNPLNLNPLLNQSAQAKCNDMVARNYWAHNTPDGAQPWVFIDNVGIEYDYAAENLATGYYSGQGVVDGWMKSESHKKNLLNSKYTDVGYAVCSRDNYASGDRKTIVVQHFIR